MSNLRQPPRPGLLQRLLRAVGEISALRSTGLSAWASTFWTPYRLDSSRVNYTLARELYANTNDRYKLGAGFARPIINSSAGFMGAPHFTHPDPEADQALEEQMERWTGRLLRVNRNALRDGDVFARIAQVEDRLGTGQKIFDLVLVPPEWVTPVPDPLTGGWQELVIRYPVEVRDAKGSQKVAYTVTETWRPKEHLIEYDSRAPTELQAKNGLTSNPFGFIPVVHFRNEAEEHLQYGCSDLEPVEPFLRAYHDVMLYAVQGSKLFSRPKARFALRDVKRFLADNFPAEEINAGKLKFAEKELFLMAEGDDVSFITPQSGLEGITTLLKFLFFCIVDVSETPEFAFGTAVASSKASVSEQMVPLARKIRRKRGLFEDPYGELASMYLAMWARLNNRALKTYQVEVGWEELSPKNDQEVATTVKTLVEGLSTGLEAGLLSVDAAAEFLREFIPSMLPWLDPDGDDDERRRVARSLALVQRLRDGQGLEEVESAPPAPPAGAPGQGTSTAGEQSAREPAELEGSQDPFVYLIHHVHHVLAKGRKVREELHHCPLFPRVDGQGEEFEVEDLRDGERVLHVLRVEGDAQVPAVVYDHLGNAYRIVARQVAGRRVWVVAGLKPGQKVRWSDAQA